MANPQKENGYVPIATEILEALSRSDLNGGEFRIILTVIRKTWGWKKKDDWISLTQLEELTGFSHWYVSKIKKQLIKRNILLIHGKKLGFNKHYDKWVVSNSLPVSNRTTGSKQQNNLPVSNSLLTIDTITINTNTIKRLEKMKEDLISKKIITRVCKQNY